jgi:SAM-dependent methyltransferase
MAGKTVRNLMYQQVKSHEDLVNFYLTNCDGKSSIFEIWEGGGARGDSVTPSTYSPQYRSWMRDMLAAELERTGGSLLSLGCGNAAVEAELVRAGYTVLAVDALEEAVALARSKGVEAVCADFYQWEPRQPYSVVYLDGVLGHMHDPLRGLLPALERVRSWLAPATGDGAAIVASNDAPKDGNPVQQAPGIAGFKWLSAQYLLDQVLAAGFADARAQEFRYQRPLSGDRCRAVVVGLAAG